MHIRHVTIHSSNLDAQRRFYTHTLGFPLLDDGPDYLLLSVGTSTLMLRENAEMQIHHIAFAVPEHQFEQVLAWTQARVTVLPFKGKPFIDFSKSSWQAKSVYFEDMAGNVLEFIARHRLPDPAAPPTFSSRSVRGISEIGLASLDVPALVDQLQAAFGLPVFDGSPDSSFCALGDDHGLLICVEAGRNWLPTDNRPSGVYPVRVALAGHHDHTLTVEGHPYTLRSFAAG